MTDDPDVHAVRSPAFPTLRGVVDAHHPMLAGHFPGHPIVPGAWLLAWVGAAAARWLANDTRVIAGVKRVKFLRPVTPDQAFECALSLNADTMRFSLTSNGVVVVSGSLQLQTRVGR